MARYFFIATILVLAIAIVASAWWAAQQHARLQIASVSTTMAPRAEPASTIDYDASNRPFIATVPWALSVVPECLEQTLSARGSDAYVQAKMPNDAHYIQPPATLQYADCTIEINATSALVKRGPDRLTIPPNVSFYKDSQNELLVLRQDQHGAELRVYRAAH